jgi:1-acyl-sn-glycerol-3-phosphate acyltransferase
MVRNAQAEVAQGRSLVIFPEGTRVRPGEQPPLQPGFAGLYRALRLPVVPVALDTGRFWRRRGFAKQPGVATFRFGAPIPAGLPRDEIEARVHAAINVLERQGLR